MKISDLKAVYYTAAERPWVEEYIRKAEEEGRTEISVLDMFRDGMGIEAALCILAEHDDDGLARFVAEITSLVFPLDGSLILDGNWGALYRSATNATATHTLTPESLQACSAMLAVIEGHLTIEDHELREWALREGGDEADRYPLPPRPTAERLRADASRCLGAVVSARFAQGGRKLPVRPGAIKKAMMDVLEVME